MSKASVIRVLFADDHPLAQSGMRNFLDAYDDLTLVGAATSGEEALQLCGELQPDVVLMDLLMPGMGGVEATRQIKQRYPQMQVIALTSHQDGDMVAQALKAGARSYLLKNVAALDLAQAIRAAMVGRAVLAPEVQDALVATMSQDKLGSDLSEREREVLTLLAQGFSNQQIAQQLVISPSTTKYHIRNIFEKLGVTSRAEAIALAYQRRLVARP